MYKDRKNSDWKRDRIEAPFGSEVEVTQFVLDCSQKKVPQVQQLYYLK
jgi:hypothetical protein